MCQVLEVSRSAYYAWKIKDKSHRQKENEELIKRVVEIHESSHKIYGSPRITHELRSEGLCVGENRVARLMHVNGI